VTAFYLPASTAAQAGKYDLALARYQRTLTAETQLDKAMAILEDDLKKSPGDSQIRYLPPRYFAS
jgi:hypothetical protein